MGKVNKIRVRANLTETEIFRCVERYFFAGKLSTLPPAHFWKKFLPEIEWHESERCAAVSVSGGTTDRGDLRATGRMWTHGGLGPRAEDSQALHHGAAGGYTEAGEWGVLLPTGRG